MNELLEKLEKKVLELIEKNKKLQKENVTLEKKTAGLQAEKGTLENSLVKEHGNIDNLVKEKNSIKGAIEALLNNIKVLESSKE